jgi:hypothetical protein
VVANTSRLRVGLAAAATAFTALAAGAAFAFGKFEEAENVMQQTAAVIESTGGAANVSAEHVDKLATSLSKLSGVDDETIASGENMLLTFKNIRNEAGAGNDIFDQTTKATLDMAAAMAAASGSSIDLKAASIQMGKALNDPVAGITALTRVGVTFSEDQKKQIEQLVKHNNILGAQKLILAEVTSEFQGSAEAQATASGKAAVAFENLAEAVGSVLAPAFEFLLKQLNDLLGFLQDKVPAAWDAFTEGVGKAWNTVKPFAETIGNVLVPFLETAWHTIQSRLLPALKQLAPILIPIGIAIAAFGTMIVVQLALAVTAITLVIDAFGEVVQFVRDKVVEPIGNFLARIVTFIEHIITWVRERLVGAWQTAFGAMSGPIGVIIEAVKTLVGWIQTAIEFLHDMFAAGGAAADVGAETGRPGVGNQPVPHAATGGFVARSGLAVIHQGETISPAGSGFSGDITLVLDGQVLAKITRDQLVQLQRRNVSTGIA